MDSRSTPATHQRGAATVLVMLGLLAVLALGMLFANRGLLLESRMSANQARSTIAFEAAEAGLAWALAQLDTPERSGRDCRPDAASTSSFRDRVLITSATGLVVRTAPDGGPMRAACIRRAGAWACDCPLEGAVTLPTSDDPDPASFVVELRAGEHPGLVRIVSQGRISGRAGARVEAMHALLPALGAAPAAALTARGTIDAGTASLANEDPLSAGLVLHAGGSIAASAARLTTTAGSSSDGTLAANDSALAATSVERQFVATFGLPREAWRRQAGVRSIDCSVDCTGALESAAGAQGTHSMLWIEGDTRLAGPMTLGRPEQPVVLVVHGHLVFDGPVTVHGLVHADGFTWQGAAGGALNGALVSSADIALSAGISARRDAAVLAALIRQAGTFVRVPGSWRDF